MAQPAYKIFYGKYPDVLTNEVPSEQIMEVSGLSFAIEPGKPAEPKVQSCRFTLVNLDWDGTERYPPKLIDFLSRSEAEGAVIPQQLFLKIEIVATGQHFLGVLDSTSYGKYRETITLKVKGMMKFLQNSNMRMLKPLKLDDCQLSHIYGPVGGTEYNPNLLDIGYDLNGKKISQQYLLFSVENWEQLNPDSAWRWKHQKIIDHFFDSASLKAQANDELNSGAEAFFIDKTTAFMNGFIQVGDITLLTLFSLELRLNYFGYGESNHKIHYDLSISVNHAKNSNITDDNGNVIFQRGRYFADDQGTELKKNNAYTITLLEPDRGGDATVMLKEETMPGGTFVHGCPITIGDLQEYTINESSIAHYSGPHEGDTIDLLDWTIYSMRDSLFAKFYSSVPYNDPFDVSNAPLTNRYVFWADVMMFGWLGAKPGDVMVNLATMLNCYLFLNEQGKITFQDRLLHEDYLPNQLPPGAFQVQMSDIQPLGDQQDNNGFDSYEVETNDRIPINNVESEKSQTVYVDDNGIRTNPALRNSELKVESYRSDNLGVPARANGLPLFRRSPDDANFGISGVDLTDFLPTAEHQAEQFAKSWTYPARTWNIQWDMGNYPDAGIGGYFWVSWPDAPDGSGPENRVYLIRQITHDVERMLHKLEVQQVGVWNG